MNFDKAKFFKNLFLLKKQTAPAQNWQDDMQSQKKNQHKDKLKKQDKDSIKMRLLLF